MDFVNWLLGVIVGSIVLVIMVALTPSRYR